MINKSKTLKEAIEVQAVANPAFVGATENTADNKKISEKNVEKTEKAGEELVKNGQPDSHDDITTEVKKLQLDESLRECDYEEEGSVLTEDVTDYDFKDLFWWIYGDEDPLNLGVEFPTTVKFIEDNYGDVIWEDDEAEGDPNNLSEEQREAILDLARKEALSWRQYNLYNMPARYTNTLTLYKGLRKLLDIECDRLDESNESLTEAVEESTFSKLYRDLVEIPYVDRFVRTKFSKDEKKVDLSIILDDYVDVDAVYDVLDSYQDKIDVDEDDEAIHIHLDTSDVERKTDIPADLFDEIMTQLTLGGRMIPGREGGKGYVTDYGAGYDETTQVANAEGDKGIVLRIFPGHESDKKGSTASFEPAKAIADKYKDLGVYYTERDEIEKVSPHRVTKVLTIWIPEGAKAAGRDERVLTHKKRRKVREAVVTTSVDLLTGFEPANYAAKTFRKIQEAGKLNELDDLVNDLYDGAIDNQSLNNLLYYEAEWLFKQLGIKEEE